MLKTIAAANAKPLKHPLESGNFRESEAPAELDALIARQEPRRLALPFLPNDLIGLKAGRPPIRRGEGENTLKEWANC